MSLACLLRGVFTFLGGTWLWAGDSMELRQVDEFLALEVRFFGYDFSCGSQFEDAGTVGTPSTASSTNLTPISGPPQARDVVHFLRHTSVTKVMGESSTGHAELRELAREMTEGEARLLAAHLGRFIQPSGNGVDYRGLTRPLSWDELLTGMTLLEIYDKRVHEQTGIRSRFALDTGLELLRKFNENQQKKPLNKSVEKAKKYARIVRVVIEAVKESSDPHAVDEWMRALLLERVTLAFALLDFDESLVQLRACLENIDPRYHPKARLMDEFFSRWLGLYDSRIREELFGPMDDAETLRRQGEIAQLAASYFKRIEMTFYQRKYANRRATLFRMASRY